MSVPENPLAQYHTYSYHHVILACESTDVAEAVSKSNEFVTYLREPLNPEDQSDPNARYRPITAKKDGKDGEEIGKYIIVLNGMTDAEFVVSSVKWHSKVGQAGPNGYDRFTTFNSSGTMTIEEPRGVRFLNVLAEASKEIKKDGVAIIYVLKTIFIGYPSEVAFTVPDDSSYRHGDVYDPITNIRPLMFNIKNVIGQFNVTGGSYVIEFAATHDGASKTPHIMRSSRNLTLNFGSDNEGKALANGINKLQRLINHSYMKYYNKVKKDVEKLTDANGNKTKFRGIPVEYIIIVEEPYAKYEGRDSKGRPRYKANGDYQITDFMTVNTDKGTKDEPGIISFGKTATIESAINAILFRCEKVKEDASGEDSSETGYKFSYVPTITTDIISTPEKYQVIYNVSRRLLVKQDIIELARTANYNKQRLNGLVKDEPPLTESQRQVIRRQLQDLENNTLQLYYFFTGRNTDIIDFDIKMNYGLSFFQTLLATEVIPEPEDSFLGLPPEFKSSKDDALSKQHRPGKVDGKNPDRLQDVNPNTPIFPATKFDDKTTKHTKKPDLSLSYQQQLSRSTAVDSMGVKVKIHGNPGLLNSTNKSPSEGRDRSTKNRPLDIGADKERDLFPYWQTTPAMVKIDIRMPGGENDVDFTHKFWYDGFYYCQGIEHSFEAGEFTQTLTLFAVPPKDPRKDKEQTDDNETQQRKQAEQARKEGGANAGVSQSTTEAQTSNQIVKQSEAPGDKTPEQMPVLDYVKSFFKDLF